LNEKLLIAETFSFIKLKYPLVILSGAGNFNHESLIIFLTQLAASNVISTFIPSRGVSSKQVH
jgi:hypothetical protein